MIFSYFSLFVHLMIFEIIALQFWNEILFIDKGIKGFFDWIQRIKDIESDNNLTSIAHTNLFALMGNL